MITLSVLVVIVLLNDIRAGKTDLHCYHLPSKNVSCVIGNLKMFVLRSGKSLLLSWRKTDQKEGSLVPRASRFNL